MRNSTIVLIAKMIATAYRQARQVALDDVRSALRLRREAHPAHSRVAAGVHQDETHEGHRDEDVPDGENLQHRGARVPDASG